MTIKLVRINQSQSDKLQEILEGAPNYHFHINGTYDIAKDSGTSTLSTLPPKIDPTNKYTFLIEKNNNYIGAIDLVKGYPTANTAFIGLLLLVEEFQGQGLGFQSYQELENFIKSDPLIDVIELAYVETNPVDKFWKKLGFRKTGKRKVYHGTHRTSFSQRMQKKLARKVKTIHTYHEIIVNSNTLQTQYHDRDQKICEMRSNFSDYFHFQRNAIQVLEVPSGYTASLPHSEKCGDEFVYVISGEIDCHYDGKIKKMKAGQCIGFPSGNSIAYIFINNSAASSKLFVVGKRTKVNHQYCNSLEPERESKLFDDTVRTLDIKELIKDTQTYSYPGDHETFGHGYCLSREYNIQSFAVWFEKLPAQKRSSWPHAHSVEEEFVLVLSGSPTLWLNHQQIDLNTLDGVNFKAGSGLAHTIINKSDEDITYLCVGECKPINDKIIYPLHPKRNKEMGQINALWNDAPSFSDQLLIRKTLLSDLKAVERAHRNSILELCSSDYTKQQIYNYADINYCPKIWANNVTYDFHLVVIYDNQVEGFCHARYQDNMGYIVALYVTKVVSGLGIGRKFLDLAVDYLKNCDVQAIRLTSTVTAYPFYQKMGFKPLRKDQISIRSTMLECYKMEQKFDQVNSKNSLKCR